MTIQSTIREDTDLIQQVVCDPGRKICRTATGRIWVVYANWGTSPSSLCAAYSDDDGENWTEETITSSDDGGFTCSSITIDSGDTLHVVYQIYYDAGGGDWRLDYKTRPDASGSGSWSSPTSLDTNSGWFDITSAHVFVDSSDNVHVVWGGRNFSGGGADFTLAFLYKMYNGSWQATEEVSFISGSSAWYGISGSVDSSGVVHCAFASKGYGDHTSNVQIVYRKRTGEGWQSAILVTNVASDQGYMVSLVVDSSEIVGILWEGKGSGDNPTAQNIYFNRIVSDVLQTQELVTDVATAQTPSAWGFGLTLGIDQSDNYDAIWSGTSWGVNTTKYSVQHRHRDGSWGSQEDLVNEATHQIAWSALWATYPSNQIPSSYMFSYESEKGADSSDLEFYSTVPPAAPPAGMRGFQSGMATVMLG